MGAEAELVNAEQHLERVKGARAGMLNDSDTAKGHLMKIKKTVHDLEEEIRRLEAELARLISQSISHLAKIAWESYQWLLTHQVPSYGAPSLKDGYGGYAPPVPQKMRTVINGLQDLKLPEKYCIDTLISCVFYGLGPAPAERSESQNRANELVGKALGQRQSQLQHYVADRCGSVNLSLKDILLMAGTAEDGGKAKSTAAEIVKTKEKALDDIRSHQSVLIQKLDTARREVSVAEQKLKAKSQEKSQCDARYNDVGVLRDGVSQPEARTFLGLLDKFFRLLNLEEGLIHSFQTAVLHTPQERGVFCHESIKCILECIVQLQQKLAAEEEELKRIWTSLGEEVRSIEQEIESLKEQIARAVAEVTAAKDLLKKVHELEMFNSEIMGAYQWLLTRPGIVG